MADEIEKEEYAEYIHSEKPEIESQEVETGSTVLIDVFQENNKDSDQDGLKDFAEKYFGANPKNPDTDQDGFDDYTEVYNGYNPNGDGKLNSSKKFTDILQELSHLSDNNLE